MDVGVRSSREWFGGTGSLWRCFSIGFVLYRFKCAFSGLGSMGISDFLVFRYRLEFWGECWGFLGLRGLVFSAMFGCLRVSMHFWLLLDFWIFVGFQVG